MMWTGQAAGGIGSDFVAWRRGRYYGVSRRLVNQGTKEDRGDLRGEGVEGPGPRRLALTPPTTPARFRKE